jgi:hypothetical protein
MSIAIGPCLTPNDRSWTMINNPLWSGWSNLIVSLISCDMVSRYFATLHCKNDGSWTWDSHFIENIECYGSLSWPKRKRYDKISNSNGFNNPKWFVCTETIGTGCDLFSLPQYPLRSKVMTKLHLTPPRFFSLTTTPTGKWPSWKPSMLEKPILLNLM